MSNPYTSPAVPGKLTSTDAADVKYRNLTLVAVLSLVTLGIYSLYLIYQWAKEINGLEGRIKHNPVVVLLVSIFTLCLGAVVYECLFASDAAEAGRQRGIGEELASLPTWVIALNVSAVVISIIPLAFIIAIPLGIAATVVVQSGFNKLAQAPLSSK